MDQNDQTLGYITGKIEKNNVNAGESMLNRGDLNYVIRGTGLVKDLDDLRRIVLKTIDGVPVYLNEIGSSGGTFSKRADSNLLTAGVATQPQFGFGRVGKECRHMRHRTCKKIDWLLNK